MENAEWKGTCSQSNWLVDVKLFHLFTLLDDNPSVLAVHCVIHRENLVAKSVAPTNCTKYYIMWSNVSIPSKRMPKQSVCSRGLSQEGYLIWRPTLRPTHQPTLSKKLRNDSKSGYVEDVHTKTQNQLETLRKISKKREKKQFTEKQKNTKYWNTS